MPAAPSGIPASTCATPATAPPFADLLAHVPDLPGGSPRIADLGCGPGNVTALARRVAHRVHTGYDNSPEMLDKAHTEHEGPTPGGGRLDFAPAEPGPGRPRSRTT